MAGPGDEIAAAAGRDEGDLRASHADREQVIGTLKVAFVQGRLTEDELDARVGQVYASRTYAELAEVTADIPVGLTGAQPPRDPWRATKVACGVVYALILPGLFTLAVLPRGSAPTTVREAITSSALVYVVFWILGVSVMVAVRLGERSGGRLPPRSAPGASRPGHPRHGSLRRAREAPAMTEPGNKMAADAGGADHLPACRGQVTLSLRAALAQGRLTEDEYDERMGRVSASQSRAELAALTVDLPVGRMDVPARPPTAKDVRVGVSVSIAAAGVGAAILLWQPDNGLVFLVFLIAAVTVLVAPTITVGIMADVWRQKRSGGQLPPSLEPRNR
jgi:hypothetical protein